MPRARAAQAIASARGIGAAARRAAVIDLKT